MDALTLPDRFYVDCAIGVKPFADICASYSIDPTDIDPTDLLFRKRLLQAEQAVEEDGQAFRARCRLVVNETIPKIQLLITDPDVPSSVQLEAFKTLAKLGALEPEKKKEEAVTGPQLSLTIVAPGGEKLINKGSVALLEGGE